jgi:hypothetical protein
MSYGVVLDVPASAEFYDAAHAEFAKYPAEAMILRPTATGFQVVEVWRPGRTTNGGPASTSAR